MDLIKEKILRRASYLLLRITDKTWMGLGAGDKRKRWLAAQVDALLKRPALEGEEVISGPSGGAT